MSDSSADNGVILALLERFEKQRLPRAKDIKAKTDRGETLSSSDIEYLKTVFADIQQIKPIADRHPEYQELYAKAIHLYHEITENGLANENG